MLVKILDEICLFRYYMRYVCLDIRCVCLDIRCVCLDIRWDMFVKILERYVCLDIIWDMFV